MKKKYYDLTDILKLKAQYNVIFGMRSNGKTWAVLDHIVGNYARSGKQGALIRRYLDDIMPSKISTIFNAYLMEGELKKWFKDKWDTIFYTKRKFFLGKKYMDKKGNMKILADEKPFLYVFALTEEEDYKENSYPEVTTIFFDEFLTRRGYLADEFIIFENLISTIKRGRDDVTIFMVGNTINQYCPYFAEMGLKNAKDTPLGKIELYTYGETDLKVAVQRTENLTRIDGKKDIDKYFAFDNPKLKMITKGDWEFDIYPHMPFKYLPKEIKDIYFIRFSDQVFQCEIIHHEKEWITFIHRKTTPIKDENKEIIYQEDTDYRANIRSNILRPYDNVGQQILWFFSADKVFYQDNEVGEAIHNYLQVCQRGK